MVTIETLAWKFNGWEQFDNILVSKAEVEVLLRVGKYLGISTLLDHFRLYIYDYSNNTNTNN